MTSSRVTRSEAPRPGSTRRLAADAAIAALAALAAVLALGAMGWPWDWMSPDVRGAHLARNEYAARAMLEGRLPLWNPYEFAGMPLMATASGAMLYPPVLAAHALLGRHAAFTALAFFHLFLLCFGTALYLGRHGFGRILAVFATAVALGPILLAGAAHYPNYLAALAWAPLMLFLLDGAAEGPDWRWTGALGLASAMQWLAGYPDYPMDTVVLLGVITVFGTRGSLLRPCLALAVGLGLGGAIAALQLLPLAEVVRESYRSLAAVASPWRRDFFAIPSLEGGARLLWARYGPALLALACVGASLRAGVRRGWLVAFLWCFFALNPPFVLLYRLPPWSGSRAPIGWLGLAPLVLGFLAAAGVRRMLEQASRWPRALALLLVAAALAHGRHPIAFCWERVVVPVELERVFAQRVQRIEKLLAGPARGARVLSWLERLRGQFVRHEIPSATGYEPSQLEPHRVAQMLDVLGLHLGAPTPRSWAGIVARPDLAALLGVGIVAGPPGWLQGLREAGFVEVGALPGRDRVLYRPPVPRARLVHRVALVPDEAASLARVTEHAAEAATTAVLVADRPPPELADPPPGAVEGATVVVDQPERVEIAARAASPALLVLRDTEYPGWRATVDGAPAEILRVDHAFRGVALAAGEHRVAFVYDPASVRVGRAVSGAGLAAALALLLLGGRRRGPAARAAASSEASGGEPPSAGVASGGEPSGGTASAGGARAGLSGAGVVEPGPVA